MLSNIEDGWCLIDFRKFFSIDFGLDLMEVLKVKLIFDYRLYEVIFLYGVYDSKILGYSIEANGPGGYDRCIAIDVIGYSLFFLN